MVSQNNATGAEKPAFEPSDLVEHGDAEKLTRGPHPSAKAVDGDYTS